MSADKTTTDPSPTREQGFKQVQKALDDLKACRVAWARIYAEDTDDIKGLEILAQLTNAIRQTTNAAQNAEGK